VNGFHARGRSSAATRPNGKPLHDPLASQGIISIGQYVGIGKVKAEPELRIEEVPGLRPHDHRPRRGRPVTEWTISNVLLHQIVPLGSESQ